MKSLIIASLLVLSTVFAHAQTVEPKKAIDVGTCSTMWKAHKAAPGYVDPGKGNRMGAWIDFRKTKCSKAREA